MENNIHIIAENIASGIEITTSQVFEGLLEDEELLFPDEDISLGVNSEGILAVMAIERTTERIVGSAAPICQTSPKDTKTFVSGPQFIGVQNAIRWAMHPNLPGKHFSPLPDLFMRHARRHFVPTDVIPDNPNVLTANGIKFGQAVHDFVTDIRAEYNSEAFAKKMKNHGDNYQHRHRRNKKLIARLFENHSKLCVVRLDLYLGKAENEHLSLAAARKHIHNFTNNQRHNRLFSNKVGHVIKLELSQRRGYHFHTCIFFDGQVKRNADYYANEIGHYWVNTITKGTGSFHSCHQHKNRYKSYGIGLVDWDDQEKISVLLYAMSYLAKSDQHYREKDYPKQRAWFTSRIPPRRQPHGRPRKAASTSVANTARPCNAPLGS